MRGERAEALEGLIEDSASSQRNSMKEHLDFEEESGPGAVQASEPGPLIQPGPNHEGKPNMRGLNGLRSISLAACTAVLVILSPPAAPCQVIEVEPDLGLELLRTDPIRGSDWIVKSSDSICGVSRARHITNPAEVDYQKLLDATAEMKELKREKIDKSSAHGQTLVILATQRVREAAKAVMTEKGHCSVWKEVSHKQGKHITDLTSEILNKLP